VEALARSGDASHLGGMRFVKIAVASVSTTVAAQRKTVEDFAAATAQVGTVYVLGMVVAVGGQLFNTAAVVHGGRIVGFIPKEKLPTYNVFS